MLLLLAKCIIFCVHWLPACQTPILTVANKPHIYSLSEIMKQLIVGSALMTASYLLISVNRESKFCLLCSLVACLLASYLLISVNKPHSLLSALLTASYLLSVFIIY